MPQIAETAPDLNKAVQRTKVTQVNNAVITLDKPKPRTIAASDDLWQQVVAAAEECGTSVSVFVRDVLVHHLAEHHGQAASVWARIAEVGMEARRRGQDPGLVLGLHSTTDGVPPERRLPLPQTPWTPGRGLSKAEQVAHSPKGMRAGPVAVRTEADDA